MSIYVDYTVLQSKWKSFFFVMTIIDSVSLATKLFLKSESLKYFSRSNYAQFTVN